MQYIKLTVALSIVFSISALAAITDAEKELVISVINTQAASQDMTQEQFITCVNGNITAQAQLVNQIVDAWGESGENGSALDAANIVAKLSKQSLNYILLNEK